MGKRKGGGNKRRKSHLYSDGSSKKRKKTLTVVDDSQYLFNQFFAPQQESVAKQTQSSESPAVSSSVYKSNPNPQFIGPYSNRHSILVVGDGDLSFSLSLATALSGTKLTATTSDSFGVLCKKYEKASGTVASLKASGAHVMHGVDATKLDDYDWNTRFNRIVFNFPHVGGSTPKDTVANQDLLLKFFESSTPLLVNSKSEIHISLRTTPFYKSWDIKTIGEKAGYKLRKRIDFNEDLFIRYENKRTAGDDKFRAAPGTKGESKTYMFRYIGLHNGSRNK